ncbi:MAG: FAD-binding protein, partial [Gemmatimonadetes bacterium]|nr:FAD-binding protein [Gemmatimonadota bacterium]
MLLDARNLADDVVLEADVCAIGAGPAGLTVAHSLADSGLDVVVLESGGAARDDWSQALNEGPVSGDAYAGLRATRSRGLSGSVRLWNTPVDGEPGAKFAPLDRIDFTRAGGHVDESWPFDRRHLEPHYVRAHRLCGIGPFAWDAEDWPGERAPALSGSGLTHRVYQFGRARSFTTPVIDALRSADNVRLYLHATACAIEFAGHRAAGVIVSDRADRRFRVRARIIVLAGGAVENARLLLVSDAAAVLSGSGWVGRCFMEHPRDSALTLVPRDASFFDEAAFHDRHRAADGTLIGGRIAVTDELIRAGMPNASITLLPRLKPVPQSRGVHGRALAWLRQLGRQPGTEGYGWSAVRDPAAVFDGFRLLVNLEQRPHPENRIVLADGRDAHGVPRAALHWRWREDEQAGLERLRTT